MFLKWLLILGEKELAVATMKSVICCIRKLIPDLIDTSGRDELFKNEKKTSN